MPRPESPIVDNESTAPLGEPLPLDDAPPAVLSVPRDPDQYASVFLLPEDVQGRRPRWSLSRARRWLRQHEEYLRERQREYLVGDLLPSTLSHTSGAPLRRDRRQGLDVLNNSTASMPSFRVTEAERQP